VVPRPIVDAFHQFLATVPDMARHLVINGDLFDFWFEYGTVIPRSAFPTLAALDAIRRAGVRLTITGGNHDRWSRGFWQRELGASFHSPASAPSSPTATAWTALSDRGCCRRSLGFR
jgi:UDP-2,3-diacylglucosamine hydrolase